MKLQTKRLLALLLAGLMILPTMACAKGDDPEETSGETQNVTEDDTGYKPDIKKTNYNADFTVIGTHTIMKWVTAKEDSKGDAFEDTLYERAARLKDQLGVTLVKKQSSDQEYVNEIMRNVQAGDAAYQMVAAHCHIGTASLMASGAMYDISALPSVNLDAPYWSFDFMDGLTINDQYIIGYNDFCLADAACIVINKDLLDEYNIKAPYDDVRNQAWTLEKMNTLAATVSKDNGDNVWNDKDVYGISGWGWTDMISLMIGSGIQIVEKNEDDDYVVAYDSQYEQTLNVLTDIEKIYNAVYGYFWTPGGSRGGVELPFSKGQTLMYLRATGDLTNLRDATVRFGVLPIPKYTTAQKDYRSFSWNGVLMVPSVFTNNDPAMVSDAVEMLAYYTAPVKTAFYEDLLGTKLSEAPEDAEMLEIVWSTQVTDVGMVTADVGKMTELLYLAPNMCLGGTETYASYLKARVKVTNKELDKLFNPKTRN
jgi:hypothetical protein